jgi:hypothetical protein
MSEFLNSGKQAAMVLLEAEAASARGDFACMFSSSDEYEDALIASRRSEGRYGRSQGVLPLLMFMACVMIVAGAALLSGR